jgi:formylglycine-generating enzyme required for sulfatase activity
VAWKSGNSDASTHIVRTKKANELGLYDMSGNVYEWCEDWWDMNWDAYYYSRSPSSNPKGPDEGSVHVIRGGAWHSTDECRVSDRSNGGRGSTSIGLRLAL